MAAAALAWLDSLTAAQLPAALHPVPLDPEAERERLRWYYTPTDHDGLALGGQSPTQQSLAMRLVASGLSRAGYVTTCTIIGLENVLDELEDWRVDWGRERGRDPGLYWLRVFGRPEERVWGWRLGGHHLSLNNLVVEGRAVATTPCFMGADPASSPLLGGGRLRPLGTAEDLARELMRSLDIGQATTALLHERAISDIVSGNRAVVGDGDRMLHMQDLWRGRFTDRRLADLVDRIDEVAEAASGYTEHDHARLALTRAPKGLPASRLDRGQRSALRAVIEAYVGRVPGELAEEHLARYADDAALDEVHFAWAGSALPGAPHYYRLQGPRLLVEFDNTQRAANHAHSVWRDPGSDFGLDVLAGHEAWLPETDRPARMETRWSTT